MLSIRDLNLNYDNNKKVLDDISLDINDGDCILFIGESGSGKSSIINSINGLAKRYDMANISGNIVISDKNTEDMKTYEISQMISNVFQNPKTHFFNVNTTLELIFYLENLGLNRPQMDMRLKKMLTIFPISHLLNRDIFKLSGGEKQILCIASCFISGTKIILLDEPSSNLDNKYSEVLTNMLKLLKKEGISLILSEHRIYYLMDIVDRIFLIEKGKIKKEYTPIELKELSDNERIKLGLRSIYKPKLMIKEDGKKGELVIKKLLFNYMSDRAILDISDMSFSKGKIYGIIGNNGSGKSTFVRSLIGVERKSKDDIYLDDVKLSKKDRLKNSSLVMQDVNHQLFTEDVVSEIILGVKSPDIDKVYNILRKLNIYNYKDSHPFSLSGGEKQRVAIAQSLYKDSKFMFFDEPSSGMDYKNMLRISRLIKKASKPDNFIFIISHDIELLNETADYVFDIEISR